MAWMNLIGWDWWWLTDWLDTSVFVSQRLPQLHPLPMSIGSVVPGCLYSARSGCYQQQTAECCCPDRAGWTASGIQSQRNGCTELRSQPIPFHHCQWPEIHHNHTHVMPISNGQWSECLTESQYRTYIYSSLCNWVNYPMGNYHNYYSWKRARLSHLHEHLLAHTSNQTAYELES